METSLSAWEGRSRANHEELEQCRLDAPLVMVRRRSIWHYLLHWRARRAPVVRRPLFRAEAATHDGHECGVGVSACFITRWKKDALRPVESRLYDRLGVFERCDGQACDLIGNFDW